MTRPDSPKWIDASVKGDMGEALVAAALKKLGYTVTAPSGKCSEFDLIGVDFDGDKLYGVTVEVKTDARAAGSGNLAIEVAHRGRPSGLRVTKADFWACVLPDARQVLYLPTGELIELVDSGRFHEVPVRGESGKRIVLVPLAEAKGIAVDSPLPRLWREGVA